jgi:carbamoylphosphate synthase small subunit
MKKLFTLISLCLVGCTDKPIATPTSTPAPIVKNANDAAILFEDSYNALYKRNLDHVLAKITESASNGHSSVNFYASISRSRNQKILETLFQGFVLDISFKDAIIAELKQKGFKIRVEPYLDDNERYIKHYVLFIDWSNK